MDKAARSHRTGAFSQQPATRAAKLLRRDIQRRDQEHIEQQERRRQRRQMRGKNGK